MVQDEICLSVCQVCCHVCRCCMLYSRSKNSSKVHKICILGQEIYARIILDFFKLNPCFGGKSLTFSQNCSSCITWTNQGWNLHLKNESRIRDVFIVSVWNIINVWQFHRCLYVHGILQLFLYSKSCAQFIDKSIKPESMQV